MADSVEETMAAVVQHLAGEKLIGGQGAGDGAGLAEGQVPDGAGSNAFVIAGGRGVLVEKEQIKTKSTKEEKLNKY